MILDSLVVHSDSLQILFAALILPECVKHCASSRSHASSHYTAHLHITPCIFAFHHASSRAFPRLARHSYTPGNLVGHGNRLPKEDSRSAVTHRDCDWAAQHVGALSIQYHKYCNRIDMTLGKPGRHIWPGSRYFQLG